MGYPIFDLPFLIYTWYQTINNHYRAETILFLTII